MPYDYFMCHAAEDKQSFAEPLAKKLKRVGVSVWIDTEEIQPGQSFIREMDEGINASRRSIVVVSEHLFKKANAKKELYASLALESDGVERVVPIWLGVTKAQVFAFSPILASKSALMAEVGLDAIAAKLLELTQVPQEAVGPTSPSAAGMPLDSTRPFDALLIAQGNPILFTGSKATATASLVGLELQGVSDATAASITSLIPGELVGFAFALNGGLAKVVSASVVHEGAKTTASVALAPLSADDLGMGAFEMGHGKYSAEALAVLRARRLLLDERHLPEGAPSDTLEATTLELFIRGFSAKLKIEGSPFPALYADLFAMPELFLSASRLCAAFYLRAGGIVESVQKLDFRLDRNRLLVDFVGTRPRKYVNRPACVVEVAGSCALERGHTRE